MRKVMIKVDKAEYDELKYQAGMNTCEDTSDGIIELEAKLLVMDAHLEDARFNLDVVEGKLAKSKKSEKKLKKDLKQLKDEITLASQDCCEQERPSDQQEFDLT